MTQFRTIAIALAMAGCLTAGAQKIAHVNFDSLVGTMPETKSATEAAQNFLKGLEQEIVAMQSELETKYKDYMEKEPTMSELVKKTQMEALQQLQQRTQQFQKQAEDEYRRKQQELTMPIFEKAKKGVEAVAKEMGYKYVLDTSPNNNTVLFSESSDDIFPQVKKKLDSMPPANIPGLGPPGTGGIKPAQKPQGPPPAPPQKKGK
jgi:outer membrane protein